MTDIKRPPDRTVVAIEGSDATSFMKGIVTNGPPADGGCFSALLTPQGKILFDFFIIKKDDGYFIDVHKDAAEAFVKRLMLYRLRAKVDIGIDSEHIACIDAALSNTHKGRVCVPVAEVDGIELDKDYHARRIAAGIPEWRADFNSDDVFLMDVNYDALGGVDYKKGCFIGQEVTSRMKRKGSARKRTLIAELDGVAPSKGAAITAGDSTLGEVLSSAGNKALAMIRLDRWEKAKAVDAPIMCEEQTLRLVLPEYLKQA